MEFESRIHYNTDELVRMTEAALDELKVFQYEPRYRALLGDRLVEKMAEWDRNIRARKDDPFTLVVCGEFKRGKSSFINALLGEEVVSVNVTTETVTLNRISFGPHANEAILSGGRRITLSDDELRKDRLEELMRQSPEPITQLELHRPIELLRGVTIIDTPGLNDSLRDFSDLVEHALQQADAVVYMCSVESPLAQNEQLFLRTMILPQKYTDLFIVANFADVLREADVERVRSFLDQRVAALVPGQSVLLLSALDEQCRLLNTERPNEAIQDVLAAAFDSFRQKLEELVQTKKDMLLPDRLHRLTRGMEEAMQGELDAIEAGLELDAQQAKARAAEIEAQQLAQDEEHRRLQEQLKDSVQEMEEQACQWTGELLERMCAEVDNLSAVPAEDLTKYYSLYCVDTIQEAVNRCVEHHTEQIYDQLDDIDSSLVRGIASQENRRSYGFRFALDNKTWTRGDNVGYIASKFSQLGLLSLVVDGIAGSMRQKETANRVPAILRSIKEQYPGFRKSAVSAIAGTYGKLTETVQAQLADYFKGHREEAEAGSEQLQRVARQSEENKAQIRAAIEQLKGALARLHSICN